MALSLPPLNALRAFEAAARTGSFVAAAEELGVSAAAISQHIRKLEDHFGKEMFRRLNNRVLLTDAGQAIFAGTAEALQAIAEASASLTADRSRGRLVISLIDSLAETWALPRLTAFARAEPGIRFDLRIEADPVDFARSDIDLRLCYGAAAYRDEVQVPLAQDSVQPLCSPAYLATNPGVAAGGMAQVPAADLIHTSWGPSFGSHPTWRTWFRAAGLPPGDEAAGYQVGRSSLALTLALGGLGVALAQKLMAAPDIAAGRLVSLSPIALPLGQAYALVYPRARARKRGLQTLVAWLTAPL